MQITPNNNCIHLDFRKLVGAEEAEAAIVAGDMLFPSESVVGLLSAKIMPISSSSRIKGGLSAGLHGPGCTAQILC